MPAITLTAYAAMHNKRPADIRKKARAGDFLTARKLGRDWLIDSEEPYNDKRRKPTPNKP